MSFAKEHVKPTALFFPRKVKFTPSLFLFRFAEVPKLPLSDCYRLQKYSVYHSKGQAVGLILSELSRATQPSSRGPVSRSQTTLMTFFIVEKLATCSMNSYLLPSLFHPPSLFHLHFRSILPSRLSKWTVYPCPIPVIDSASCRIGAEPTCPASRSADLKHLSGISHLIQINPPALTLSLKENGLTRVHPTPAIRSYSPSFFF